MHLFFLGCHLVFTEAFDNVQQLIEFRDSGLNAQTDIFLFLRQLLHILQTPLLL